MCVFIWWYILDRQGKLIRKGQAGLDTVPAGSVYINVHTCNYWCILVNIRIFFGIFNTYCERSLADHQGSIQTVQC